MDYPKTYSADNMPPSVRAVVQAVLPRLLDGRHPALAALREQLLRATIESVELTGAGFFADLIVPTDAPLADPPNLVGGDAELSISELPHGAGCVLFVENGRLSCLEGFTFGDEEWRERAELLSIGRVTPLDPATSQRGG